MSRGLCLLGWRFGKEGQGSQGEEVEEIVKGIGKPWPEQAASGSQPLSVNIGNDVGGVCAPSQAGAELTLMRECAVAQRSASEKDYGQVIIPYDHTNPNRL